jgi:hypothetical protein
VGASVQWVAALGLILLAQKPGDSLRTKLSRIHCFLSGPVRSDLLSCLVKLLPDGYIRPAQDDVNALMSRDGSSLDQEINETQRRLTEVEHSINVLLDLAEQFGAASAAARLLEREAEQQRLQTELKHLEAQRNAQRIVLSHEDIQRMLTEMKDTLHAGDIKAKRALLKKLVAWVELGNEGGNVAFTFPLRDAGLYSVPPGRLERPRTAPEAAALSTELRGLA